MLDRAIFLNSPRNSTEILIQYTMDIKTYIWRTSLFLGDSTKRAWSFPSGLFSDPPDHGF